MAEAVERAAVRELAHTYAHACFDDLFNPPSKTRAQVVDQLAVVIGAAAWSVLQKRLLVLTAQVDTLRGERDAAREWVTKCVEEQDARMRAEVRQRAAESAATALRAQLAEAQKRLTEATFPDPHPDHATPVCLSCGGAPVVALSGRCAPCGQQRIALEQAERVLSAHGHGVSTTHPGGYCVYCDWPFAWRYPNGEPDLNTENGEKHHRPECALLVVRAALAATPARDDAGKVGYLQTDAPPCPDCGSIQVPTMPPFRCLNCQPVGGA